MNTIKEDRLENVSKVNLHLYKEALGYYLKVSETDTFNQKIVIYGSCWCVGTQTEQGYYIQPALDVIIPAQGIQWINHDGTVTILR